MWEVGYEAGNPLLGDALGVELAAEYPGEPGKLFKALLDCRLIDELPDGLYQIHDLLEIAPEYVTSRWGREQERKKDKVCGACGTIYHSPDPRSKYCSPACKTRQWRYSGKPPRDETVTDRDGASVTVTERDGTPAPAPAPVIKDPPLIPPSGGEGDNSSAKKTRRKTSDTQQPVAIPPELDTPAFRAAWEEWLQHRREKRNAATPTAQKRQLAKLAKLGAEAATRTVDNSVAQGWVGIFSSQSDGKLATIESEADRQRKSRETIEKYSQPEQAKSPNKTLLSRVQAASNNGRTT